MSRRNCYGGCGRAGGLRFTQVSPYIQQADSHNVCKASQQSCHHLLLSLTLHTITSSPANGAADGFVRFTLATLHQPGSKSVGHEHLGPPFRLVPMLGGKLQCALLCQACSLLPLLLGQC